jgi:pimeloyl-ACP methyl ester carboxylesterase
MKRGGAHLDAPLVPVAHDAEATLATRAIAGDPYMHDPELRERLAEAQIPVLVIWGDSDGIAGPAYGRAYAESFPNARFELVTEAGHLPQIEQPAATLALIDAFANRRQ